MEKDSGFDIYLGVLGMSPLQVGVIVTGTLLGSGVLTIAVGLRAYRYHYRQLLLLATALMTGTGIGFALLSDFWPLLAVAFGGTLNPPHSGACGTAAAQHHARDGRQHG